MSPSEKGGIRVAIIGGTGLESLLKTPHTIRVGTPYGLPPPISVGETQGRSVIFLPRHGHEHSAPPHRVNYRANIYALHTLGVKRIIATNAVGAINLDLKPTDLVIPHDLIDFTRQRPSTFFDDSAVHIDFSEPFCPYLRGILAEEAKKTGSRVWDMAVYACTEGPRFETPAEIRMLRILGCDVVGMTVAPEAALARELGICYASLCFVSNMAAGISERLTSNEVLEASKSVMPQIRKVIEGAISRISDVRNCLCSEALSGSKVG
ncbi:MAG: S-methyl-5'-thioadenosine phosphorylase [Nitrososphaerota archaeon]|nr:S-methyl-5'-thioadenosine phosphorylase [Candidatus Bathyarchaeota archaeon]MDW8048584.1 S-methyl-5'-thioadenosine phosphorylase [Nitrososphaerota archaeon]